MNNIIKKMKKMIKRIIGLSFVIPFHKVKNNKIVFDNFNGKGYGGNPKYIAEELIKTKKNLDLVWIVNDINTEIPDQIRKVKRGTLQAMYEWATAKIWIDNVRNYKGVRKKKNQYYVMTWHGPLGLKKSEAQVECNLSKEYVKEAKYDGSICNLIPVTNKIMVDMVSNYFWFNGEVLYSGNPRNSILYHDNPIIKKSVFDFYEIPYKKSILLYCPTFRNSCDLEIYNFDFKRILSALNRKFDKDFILAVRLHPNISFLANKLDMNCSFINFTNYEDAQELVVASDVCITDYSSFMFDFAIMNKPVFLLAKDKENYEKNERDLIFQLKELPFVFSNNIDELVSSVNSFNNNTYLKNKENFFEKVGMVKKDTSCQDIVDRLLKKME